MFYIITVNLIIYSYIWFIHLFHMEISLQDAKNFYRITTIIWFTKYHLLPQYKIKQWNYLLLQGDNNIIIIERMQIHF